VTACRVVASGVVLGLVGWGIALGAWVSVAAAVALGWAVWRGPGALRPRVVGGVALAVILVAGPVETLVSVHQIGGRARRGALGARDQVAVYGFNAVFGASAVAAGFGAFGQETLLLGVPWSLAGPCPDDRLRRYGAALPRAYPGHRPRLRRWTSDLPMRSPKVRRIVRGWAEGLPASGGERSLGPVGPLTWPSSAYTSADASNQAAAALNTPTTRLSGRATPEGGRWRLDLVVDLAVAYPERATLWVGPFGLEEGMFHDARLLLQPYCAEYRWSVWADDPGLQRTEPVRGPIERLSTWALRAAGAGYRRRAGRR
jgi:hypothetical protein